MCDDDTPEPITDRSRLICGRKGTAVGDELWIDPDSVHALAGDLEAASPGLTDARRSMRAQFGPDSVPAALAECAEAYARAFALAPAAIRAMETSAADIADGLRAAAKTVHESDSAAGQQIGQAGSSA